MSLFFYFSICETYCTLSSIRKVKTDRADAMKIANYGLTFWIDLQEYAGEDENRQLLKIQSRLYERTATTAGLSLIHI